MSLPPAGTGGCKPDRLQPPVSFSAQAFSASARNPLNGLHGLHVREHSQARPGCFPVRRGRPRQRANPTTSNWREQWHRDTKTTIMTAAVRAGAAVRARAVGAMTTTWKAATAAAAGPHRPVARRAPPAGKTMTITAARATGPKAAVAAAMGRKGVAGAKARVSMRVRAMVVRATAAKVATARVAVMAKAATARVARAMVRAA